MTTAPQCFHFYDPFQREWTHNLLKKFMFVSFFKIKIREQKTFFFLPLNKISSFFFVDDSLSDCYSGRIKESKRKKRTILLLQSRAQMRERAVTLPRTIHNLFLYVATMFCGADAMLVMYFMYVRMLNAQTVFFLFLSVY